MGDLTLTSHASFSTPPAPAAAVPFHAAAVEVPLAALVAEAEVMLTAAAVGCG